MIQSGKIVVLQLSPEGSCHKLLERENAVIVHTEAHGHVIDLDNRLTHAATSQIQDKLVLALVENYGSHHQHSQSHEHTLGIYDWLWRKAI